jgi:hypothetical protein
MVKTLHTLAEDIEDLKSARKSREIVLVALTFGVTVVALLIAFFFGLEPHLRDDLNKTSLLKYRTN